MIIAWRIYLLKLFIDISEEEFYDIEFTDEEEKKEYVLEEAKYCKDELEDFVNSSEEDEKELRQTLLLKRVEFGRSKNKIDS